jgi:two-component system chemotaxis response regulator CheB
VFAWNFPTSTVFVSRQQPSDVQSRSALHLRNTLVMKGRFVVIGGSFGGIDVLRRVVKRLPKTFPAPILVVQHIASDSPGTLPQILSRAGLLPAIHPIHGQTIEPGLIYVAPPDRHMLVDDHAIRLSHGPKENRVRPAIDPLFRSAALAHGRQVIGVVLTGHLNDGTAGLLAIKDRGGTVIVQDPQDAVAPSMPLSAQRHVAIDYHCNVDTLADVLMTLVNDPPTERPDAADSLLEIETRIAEGQLTANDWWRLEKLSVPSGINCPDCRSALYCLNDRRVLRFRCRSGHGFTAESLLSSQGDARGNLLSSIFGALLEEASLARQLINRAEYADDQQALKHLREQCAHLEQQADQVWLWLRELPGLVEHHPDDALLSVQES